MLETPTHCVKSKASAHSSLWTSETRLNLKEQVRLYCLSSVLGLPGGAVEKNLQMQ